MKIHKLYFIFLYIVVQLFLCKSWARTGMARPSKSDVRIAKEFLHFKQAVYTDTLAFEMRLRQYVQDLHTASLNDIQRQNLVDWFAYLEKTNQFVEMSSNIRQTILRLQLIKDRKDKYIEWLGNLYFKLGMYYSMTRNEEALKHLFIEFEMLLHQVEAPLVHYYFHSLKGVCTMNQYQSENGLLSQANALQVLASAQKANEYLVHIPLDILDKYHVKPVWGFYRIALLYEKNLLPFQSDSVIHYIDKATHWATYAILKKDTAYYYDAMVNLYNLRADMLLKQNRSREALQYVRIAMRYADRRYMSKLTYERAFLDCYKCMAHIYRKDRNNQKAFQYTDSVLVWQKRAADTQETEILQSVAKQMRAHIAEKMVVQMREKLKNSRMFTLLSLLSTCLVSVIFFFVFLVYRQRRSENDVQLKAVQEQVKEKTEALNGMMHTLEQPPSKHQAEKLRQCIMHHPIPDTRKEQYLSSLDEVDYSAMEKVIGHAVRRVTSTDRFYMVCFIIDMKVEDISILLNVEPSTVYAVRYRIKKKFPEEVHESLIGF